MRLVFPAALNSQPNPLQGGYIGQHGQDDQDVCKVYPPIGGKQDAYEQDYEPLSPLLHLQCPEQKPPTSLS